MLNLNEKSMRKLITFIVLFLGIGLMGYSQTVQITGKVTYSEDGSTLPGVAVVGKGTTIGVTTDIDGMYSIVVPATVTSLEFSFIGMRTEDVEINGRTSIDLVMYTDIMAMDEVVVIGYGTAKRVGTVIGSLTQVSAEKIKEKPVANVFDALQGRVAGVQVYTSSGEPSQVSSIRLHGTGSLGASSTPLYVLDGVPIPSGTMLSLNPNDFESMTVLKDASATSIYGSRAANGVIYITTKSGKRSAKAKISISSQYGISKLANKDFFEAFMNTKQLTDFWVETGYRTQAAVDALLAANPNDTKWYKYYYKESAPTYQSDVSVTGGTEKTSYFVSGSYFFQDGLATRSSFERYSFRSNMNSKINDWITIGLNLSGGKDIRETNPYGSNSTNRGLAMLAPPFYSPYDADGNPYEGVIPGWGRYDPYYLEKKLPSWGVNFQFNGMAFIQLNPMKGLTIRSQAGVDGSDYRTTSIRYPSYVGSLNNGSVTEGYQNDIYRTITNTIEYKFSLQNRHNFTVLAGQEGSDYAQSFFSSSSSGHTDDRLILLSAGPNSITVNQSKTEYAYLSYFGRLDYGFDNKYFFDFSLRSDASSRFGANNRTANFWAAGAMWNAKKESFLEGVDFLSSLNVKFSIGTSGNSAIGNYDSQALVGTSQYDGITSWGISSPGNPDLMWEEQTKATFGIKFAILDNRYRFNIEYYDRTTKNMLISVPYPYTSGFNSITSNVGSLKNSGIDFEFDFDVLKSGDFYVTPYVNFSYNKNEVTELFQDKPYWIIPNTGVCWAVGEPVSFFRPIFAGIDPDDGAPTWYVPGDNIVETTKDDASTTKSFVTADLEQNTGLPRYAPIAGGFGLSAGWKGLQLTADFSYAKGKYLFNNDRYFFENPNVFGGFNMSSTVLDYWQQAGDVTTFPRWSSQFTQFDSRLIEDASFMRLKNLTLSFTLPESVVRKTGSVVSGARVFVTGRNLLTFTKYMGPDPEVDSNISLGANPNTKQYSFGVELSF